MNITMYDWGLYGNTNIKLAGTADNHPKLGRFANIAYTSEIIDAKLIDNKLEVQTENSHYSCPLCYMRIPNIELDDSYKEHEFDIVAQYGHDFYKCIDLQHRLSKKVKDNEALALEKEIKEHKNDMKNAKNELYKSLEEFIKDKSNSFYLELGDTFSGGMSAYNINGKIGKIDPYVHVGTFQDSVLYMEDDLVDFRYFPDNLSNAIRIYNWSISIEHLYIKNISTHTLFVDRQEIAPNETAEIIKSNYKCGLISPDRVSGQSVLFDKLKDAEFNCSEDQE